MYITASLREHNDPRVLIIGSRSCHMAVRRNASHSPGVRDTPAKGIVEIGSVIHPATGDKCLVTMTRPSVLRWPGIASKHLNTGSVCDAFLHPFGGESVAQRV